MKLKLLFISTLCGLGIGCTNTTQKIPNEQELLRKELHRIDWTQVDTYPSYDLCDSLKDEKEIKECFFTYFQQDIERVLQQDSVLHTSKYKNNKALLLEVTILPNAAIELHAAQDNPELDSLLFTKTTLLQPLHPATKRGVPVKTKFSLEVSLR